MRVLGASVLIFQAIVIGLAIPVAINVSDQNSGLALTIGLVLVLAAVVVAGSMKRSWAVPAGWAIQAVTILTGIVVPTMLILGPIFAVLWYAALKLGRQVDEAKAAAAQAESDPIDEHPAGAAAAHRRQPGPDQEWSNHD